MFERGALPRVLPFFAYLLFIAVADLLSHLGFSGAQLRWLYPLKIAVVLALLLAYRLRYLELAGAGLSLRGAAVALLAGALVLVLWINLDAGWMRIGSPAGFDPRDAGRINWPLALVRLAGAALVVPVMEELFWRSFLMRWLSSIDFLALPPARVKWLGFVASVILFGFEHDLWLAGVVAGSTYSILYMRSGTLWSPILAHGVTNLMLGIWILYTNSWAYW